MVQADVDPLTGARRDAVLISRQDAKTLGLKDGDAVFLRSESGTFQGRCYTGSIKERNLQVFWPEGNVLLQRGRGDPASGIPNYNTVVEVKPGTGG
jgi:anaerobic selenocysteine-containing dehydrogenase